MSPPLRRSPVSSMHRALGATTEAESGWEWALVLSEPGGEEVLLPKIEQAAGPGSLVTDATHLFAAFALAGPGQAEVLARLTSWDPSSLPAGRSTGAPIAEVGAVVVRRDLEVPVFEVLVATELARYVWETVLDVIGRSGGGPAGWTALRAEGWS